MVAENGRIASGQREASAKKRGRFLGGSDHQDEPGLPYTLAPFRVEGNR